MKNNRVLLLAMLLTLLCNFGADAKVYLVAVGINDYPGTHNDVQYCANDARAMVQLYKSNGNLADYALLTNSQAKRDNIIAAIEKTFAKAKPDDMIVFYYEGHGTPISLLAYDHNLTYDQIRKAMAKSRSKHKMIFSESCFSGGMRTNAGSNNKKKANNNNTDVMLFMSSRGNEYSRQYPYMAHSTFTTYLIEALNGNADTNRDHVVTAKELFTYVSNKVKKKTNNQQHPVMWGNFKDSMPVMRW